MPHTEFAWQGVVLEYDDDDDDDANAEMAEAAVTVDFEPTRIVGQVGELFEVKWRGCAASKNTFQSAADLDGCTYVWGIYAKEQLALKLLELYRSDKDAYVTQPCCIVALRCGACRRLQARN